MLELDSIIFLNKVANSKQNKDGVNFMHAKR